MHVAFAADGGRVAELARHLFDSGAKIALRLSCAVEAFELIERHCREYRARPGAEVLCRNGLAGDFLEIAVHVGRRDVLAISGFVDVLEQFLTGQLLARFYDLGDAPVPYAQRPLFAALAGTRERIGPRASAARSPASRADRRPAIKLIVCSWGW